MKYKPFVSHPHEHQNYLTTFLDRPQIKSCSNYMYPKYEHYNNSITINEYRTICATDVTFKDCGSYVGVLVKIFEAKNIIKKE